MPKKFIVITSIFPPSEAVKRFAKIKDWQLVVVGDKKTPEGWHYEGVIYLGPDDQEKLGYSIIKYLPWNHYCRKLTGYLYAINQGAELIADSDDDNLPYENWPNLPSDHNQHKTLGGEKFVNVYKYFTDKFIWPRGLPLTHILSAEKPSETESNLEVGIWQFLADGDPDVDAIYRLTSNEPVIFNKNSEIILDTGVVSPFNSQNTVFKKDLFPLLYLPAFVTFRFTDILRGLVAQPVLWNHDYHLGIGPATAFQERNPHNYLKDFESEIPVYLNSEKVIDISTEALEKTTSSSIAADLLEIYKALEKEGIVTGQELQLLGAWIEDIRKASSS